MSCERCPNPASLQITEISGGRKRRVALCPDCARREGVFLSPREAAAPRPQAPSFEVTSRCPRCQTSLAAIRRDGRVGCPQCYQVFRPHLRQLLQRLHGEVVHRGRRPGSTSPTLKRSGPDST